MRRKEPRSLEELLEAGDTEAVWLRVKPLCAPFAQKLANRSKTLRYEDYLSMAAEGCVVGMSRYDPAKGPLEPWLKLYGKAYMQKGRAEDGVVKLSYHRSHATGKHEEAKARGETGNPYIAQVEKGWFLLADSPLEAIELDPATHYVRGPYELESGYEAVELVLDEVLETTVRECLALLPERLHGTLLVDIALYLEEGKKAAASRVGGILGVRDTTVINYRCEYRSILREQLHKGI